MAETEFALGQRWVSNSEAELGLGLVKACGGRQVVMFFPAAGEERTYAVNIAPLTRMEYAIGDDVNTTDDVSFTITEKHEVNACFVYQGTDEAGEEVSVHEMDLSSFVNFSQPQDRLFAGQIDKNSRFELRVETLAQQYRLQQSPVLGLMGARVSLLPHQLYIAQQVAIRHNPRVLLADEVGLGKTIEAGLILHQLLLTGRANRILIVVPDSLVHQWLVEMLRRFNLSLIVMDLDRYQGLQESGELNPFEAGQQMVCSLSLLTENAAIYADAYAAGWDVMVVDEAHHLSWTGTQVSDAYTTIAGLAEQIPSLLLLTATPEQLGVESHFARLKLLDPARYHDFAAFKVQEENYQVISELVMQLQADNAAEQLQQDKALQQAITQYLGKTALSDLQAASDFDKARQTAIRGLLDQHGTGRIVFRNTRASVGGFPQRKFFPHSLKTPECYQIDTEIDTQELLQVDSILGENWLAVDPRVDWLVDWLKLNNNKVLLICSKANSAQDLEAYLRLKIGIRTALFHENISLVNRDRAAAYFAEEEEGAQILVCSEIGSEGRNFQFAHQLVLFDLPLNPDLLEQRIGRLDRIGQQQTVEIHLPYYEISAQDVLMQWYHNGMNAFEKVLPVGGSVYQQMESALQYCLQHPQDDKALTDLIVQTQAETAALITQLDQGRHRLLELNSYQPEVAAELVAEIQQDNQILAVSRYMGKVFDLLGVEQQTHSVDSIILHADTDIHHAFPELPEDGLTATYRRSKALSREDMAFLTWEHPMVQGAIETILHSDFGNSAFCTLKTGQFSAGSLLLEAIFCLSCPAPRSAQIQRYLPNGYLRLVVDGSGNRYEEGLSEATFNQLAGRIPINTAQDLVRHAQTQINQLIDQAERQVKPQQTAFISQAISQMKGHLQAEHQRLESLATVNPSIRPEEVEALVQEQADLATYLSAASLQLDAVRVAIVID